MEPAHVSQSHPPRPQWPLLDWGRYGDLFDFDANTGQLTLGHSRNSHGH